MRGLETTATFASRTDEFVVHSPTVSSTKVWPAGLGFSTTHAVMMVQLIVEGKSLDPHLFIVQIRSLDGTPRPGVVMGDIGLKMGFVSQFLHEIILICLKYNEADNGYADFDHIRIPRTDMLMGHGQLAADGT